MPEEIEKAAEYLSLSVQDFFNEYLGVDWWVDYPDDVFVLAPAIKGKRTGTEYPSDPRDECVFYENGMCKIHAVKPFECKEMMHNEESPGRHESVRDAWATEKNQKWIEDLLGREPESEELSSRSVMSIMGGW